MNRHQQPTIEYLREENRVLREQLGDRRLRFNDDQRRRLAARAIGLGRKLLAEIATLVHPIPCWLGRVEIAGIASNANGLWMSQIGRNVTDAVDGILNGKRYLIHDRDPLFTAEFQSILAGVGVRSVKLPPESPNLNAYAERFVRSIKESCLERLILFGENSLRTATRQFVAHYLSERHHQGLGNRRQARWIRREQYNAVNAWVEC